MGKNFSTIQSVVKNHERSHVEANVRCHCPIGEQPGRNQWLGQNYVGKEFLDTSVINWRWNGQKFFNIPNPTKLGRTGLQESDPRKATMIMMFPTESRLNSSGTFSQDSQRCSSVMKSMIFWAIWDKHQRLSLEEFCVCQRSMTSPVTEKTTRMNVLRNAESVKVLARRFGIGQWSFIGPGSEEEMVFIREQSTRSVGPIFFSNVAGICRKWHPTFRATTPLSKGFLKSKGRGKLSVHFAADQDTIDTIYRIILSVNQLSIYGAVAAICDEFVGQQDRTGNLWLLMGQSIVLGEVKAEAPLHNESSHQWPNSMEAVHSTSWNRFHQKRKWVNSVRKAGFIRVVEVGPIFRDQGHWVILDNFAQWLVANTLYLEMIQLLNQKDGFKKIWVLYLYWKSPPISSTSNMELEFELSPWRKTALILGQECHTEHSDMWTIISKTTQKNLADPQEEEDVPTSSLVWCTIYSDYIR